VKGEAWWSFPLSSAPLQGPYNFIIKIHTPGPWDAPLLYTRADIEGYGNGTTTATIQHDIHRVLDEYRQDCLEPC
jgi:hypothetical protein